MISNRIRQSNRSCNHGLSPLQSDDDGDRGLVPADRFGSFGWPSSAGDLVDDELCATRRSLYN